VDDPTRLKRCCICRLEREVREFHSTIQGYPCFECKTCHKTRVRNDYRERYDNDPEFRQAEVERGRRKRLPNLDEGDVVRVCKCHKKRCSLRLSDDTVRCSQTGRKLRAGLWGVARMVPEAAYTSLEATISTLDASAFVGSIALATTHTEDS